MKARQLFEGPMAPVEEPPVKEPAVKPARPMPTPPRPKHHPDNPFRRRVPTTTPRPKPKACDTCATCEDRAKTVVNQLLA